MVRDRSGQSEPVAVVLILFVVLIATATIFITGSAAVEDGRKAVAVSQAEQAFMELDSKTSLVGLGETETQELDLGLDQTKGSLRVTTDGWISVNFTDVNGTQVGPSIVDRQPLGAVVYTYDDTSVAYQAGGVWRTDGDGSVMVSRPEFHYNGETLTLPIVTLYGQQSLHGDVRVSTVADSFERKYPSAYKNDEEGIAFLNEVPQATPADSKINVTVQSDYYQAWEQYFRETTSGVVGSDPATKTAWVVLDAKPGSMRLDNGIIATSGQRDITIEGQGAYLDTYNSDDGAYDPNGTTGTGELVSASSIYLKGTSVVTGSLRSGGDVNLNGNTTIIDGQVFYTNEFIGNESQINTTKTPKVNEIKGVSIPDANDEVVQSNVEQLALANDNDKVSAETNNLTIVDGQLQFADGADEGTLYAGKYYLNELDYEGKTLKLDTSNGDVVIAVRTYVSLGSGGSNPGELRVVDNGAGRAVIYIDGQAAKSQGGTDYHLLLSKSSTVTVSGDRASKLTVYGRANHTALFDGSQGEGNATTFQGILFAPAGTVGSGGATLRHAQVYGAIVTGYLDIKQYSAFHYDESIGTVNLQTAREGTNIRQLHVTVREVTVEDE